MFAPIAHLKVMRILLSFAIFNKMKLYQMNVKRFFLNGFIRKKKSKQMGYDEERFNRVRDLLGMTFLFKSN